MTTNQTVILSIFGAAALYALLLGLVAPFRALNVRIGQFFFSLLPERMQVVFTIPELRRKILFTLGLLAIFRIGSQIPLPFVEAKETGFFGSSSGMGSFLEQISIFSASNVSDSFTIYGLGIMPYISASIILQLLASVWAPLEKLQKEGESGRKKINEYTRYLTVFICILQSWGYLKLSGLPIQKSTEFQYGLDGTGGLYFQWQLIAVLIMTCGTIFMMWLGEQIDEFGIGNGISLLIMAGIVCRIPGQLYRLFQPIATDGLELGGGPGKAGVETLLVLFALFVAVVMGVVFITQGQRRIPTQSAKHVRGRRVFGGTRQYLPLRVNQSGVMPIIFASSLLLIPAMAFQQLEALHGGGWFGTSFGWGSLRSMFSRDNAFMYNALYVLLIYFFCYFWTAITFNPKEMANNLKDFGSFIPGYRPGKRTADYLEKVMIRITYVGAGFLAVVAIAPTIFSNSLPNVDPGLASLYGGTSLLIAVSVAFDLCQKIDSHLVMRNYKGIMEA